MVVFIHGQPDSSQYRRFKVRLPQIPNDPAMISHTLARRLKHPEWPYPDLILIDGGKGQVSRAQAIVNQFSTLPSRAWFSLDTPVIGLAKREETLIIPVHSHQQNKWQILHLPPENPALNLLKAVRDEAHRFATTYHKLLRQKALTAAVKKE